MSKKKAATASAAALLAFPMVAQYEGLRLRPYLDPVDIKTVCYGETEGVEDRTYTDLECKKMLTARLGYYALQVDRLVTADMTPQQHAAYASFTYNVGVGAFGKSSVLRLANEGKIRESCDFLLKYVYAGGRKLPGLVKRREAERKLCLENSSPV